MDMLENKDTQKRRMPSVKVLVLAAALAVGCLLSIAAGLPMKAYQLVNGDSMVIQVDDTGEQYLYIGWESESTPIVLEEGRLWLVLNDERTDITDRIDEETPYIVEGEDPETGLKNYLIVGGTPEDYGWQMWMEMPLGGYTGGGWNTCTSHYEVDGKQVEYNDWLASVSYDGDGPIPSELVPDMVQVYKPWYENADAQLGLWD